MPSERPFCNIYYKVSSFYFIIWVEILISYTLTPTLFMWFTVLMVNLCIASSVRNHLWTIINNRDNTLGIRTSIISVTDAYGICFFLFQIFITACLKLVSLFWIVKSILVCAYMVGNSNIFNYFHYLFCLHCLFGWKSQSFHAPMIFKCMHVALNFTI